MDPKTNLPVTSNLMDSSTFVNEIKHTGHQPYQPSISNIYYKVEKVGIRGLYSVYEGYVKK